VRWRQPGCHERFGRDVPGRARIGAAGEGGIGDQHRHLGARDLASELQRAQRRVGLEDEIAEVQGDPMYPNLGDSKGALESSRKALAILESLARTEPENQKIRLDLASTHQQISDVLDFSGDTAGAVAHSGEALKIYEALAGSLASDRKFQTERVIQTYHYANLLKLAGGLDEAADEYSHLIEDYSHLAPPSDGEVIEGRVLSVTDKEVIVDIGYKLEGVIPIAQVKGPDGAVTLKRDDTVMVVIDKHGEHPEGYMLLSYDRANRMKSWDVVEVPVSSHWRSHRMARIRKGACPQAGSKTCGAANVSASSIGHSCESMWLMSTNGVP